MLGGHIIKASGVCHGLPLLGPGGGGLRPRSLERAVGHLVVLGSYKGAGPSPVGREQACLSLVVPADPALTVRPWKHDLLSTQAATACCNHAATVLVSLQSTIT